MLKFVGVVWLGLLSCSAAYPVTQEELAQYVARQQTAAFPGDAPTRRQAFLLPQAKAVYQQPAKEQVYQIQPKTHQAIYQQQSQADSRQYYAPQPQPSQQYYQPQPKLQSQYRPQASNQPLSEDPENYDPNPHYQFGFDIKDDEFTNYQQRKEQRDGDKISGSYSVVDSDGYIRTVKYTADPLEGFKADVVREPTDIKIKIPTPQPLQNSEYGGIAAAARKQQTQQYIQQPSRPQQILRPEHTQVYSSNQGQLKRIAAYTGAQQVQPQPSAYSQPSQVYQSYQEQ